MEQLKATTRRREGKKAKKRMHFHLRPCFCNAGDIEVPKQTGTRDARRISLVYQFDSFPVLVLQIPSKAFTWHKADENRLKGPRSQYSFVATHKGNSFHRCSIYLLLLLLR